MKIINEKKGFTLIELLLVVSIISLVSSIVMSSINDTRNRAQVSAILKEVRSLQTESQIHLTSYGIFSNTVKSLSSCPELEDASWGFLGSKNTLNILNSIKKRSNATAKCASSRDSWAIAFETNSILSMQNILNISTVYAQQATGYICIDSYNNAIIDIEGRNSNESDGNFRKYRRIRTSQAGDLFYCR
jgi:prepilin-type N-terminal cleavage/methylation domain-containing protein